MFLNLLKNVAKSSFISLNGARQRCLCSLSKESIKEQRALKEEKDAMAIEASLFEQSTAKYEPVSAEDILMKNKNNKNTFKNSIPNQSYLKTKPRKTLPQRQEPQIINDTDLGLQFMKLQLNDARLSTLLITVRSKKRRDKDRQIVVEGRRLILEALECGLTLKNLIFSQKEALLEIKDQISKSQNENAAQIYKVPHHDLKTWSTLTTPPGVIAIFDRPTPHGMRQLSKTTAYPITVVCDNIREPNNLGSIIRTCAAVRCFQVAITKGCCDPWDSKALRGGCGGHFRLPIRDDVNWEDVPLLIPAEQADDCYAFIAENNEGNVQNNLTICDYSDAGKLGKHNLLIIGGESHGISKQAYE